jgi:hypothetical protein
MTPSPHSIKSQLDRYKIVAPPGAGGIEIMENGDTQRRGVAMLIK